MEEQCTVWFASWWRYHGHLGSVAGKHLAVSKCDTIALPLYITAVVGVQTVVLLVSFGLIQVLHLGRNVSYSQRHRPPKSSELWVGCSIEAMKCYGLLSDTVANLHWAPYLLHILMVLFKELNQTSWWNCISFISAINCWLCLHVVNSSFQYGTHLLHVCYSPDQYVFMWTPDSEKYHFFLSFFPYDKDNREWLVLKALLRVLLLLLLCSGVNIFILCCVQVMYLFVYLFWFGSNGRWFSRHCIP